MNRSPHHTLRLLACLCLFLPLPFLAGALHAQATPAPTKTLSPASPAPALVSSYQLQSEQVIPDTSPGRAQIVVNFTTAADASGNEQLVLRFNQPGALLVVESYIDDQLPRVANPQGDELGYAWGALPVDDLPHTLRVVVTVGEAIASAAPTFQFIDAAGQPLSAPFSLSSLSVGELAAARLGLLAAQPATDTPASATTTPLAPADTLTAKPIQSPTPKLTQTFTPKPTLTPAPTITAPAVQPVMTATPPGAEADGGSGLPLLPFLLGGLLLLALVGIGALLFLRRRPAVGRIQPVGPPLAPAAPLSPGPESITRTLTLPAYLELDGDPSRRFPILRTPFAIGRDAGGDLVIDENFPQWQTVSREHAIITRHPRGYVIEDRGSRNGLRVNGRPTAKNLLRHSAQVTVGGIAFRFVDESEVN